MRPPAVTPEQEAGTACILCGAALTEDTSIEAELAISGKVVRVCDPLCLDVPD